LDDHDRLDQLNEGFELLSTTMIENPLSTTTHLAFHLGEGFFGGADFASEGALSYFMSVESAVEAAVKERMRDGGDSNHDHVKERDSIMGLTIGGDNPTLAVWSDVIQAAVDETGATFRNMPPWKEGTSLYAWVEARGLGGLLVSQRRALGQLLGRQGAADEAEASKKRTESISYLIARSIWQRGLPGPEDFIHAPFHNTFLEFLPDVVENLQRIGFETAQHVNGLL
jgi:hypothetical protein